eukprot:GHVU01220800.1.p1 GENE.GHVU01220800.1~~GHVU01220800.1.p1  ORF type:complete len:116 (+),score=8.82 GHVU01220800.1:264-611(+)
MRGEAKCGSLGSSAASARQRKKGRFRVNECLETRYSCSKGAACKVCHHITEMGARAYASASLSAASSLGGALRCQDRYIEGAGEGAHERERDGGCVGAAWRRRGPDYHNASTLNH